MAHRVLPAQALASAGPAELAVLFPSESSPSEQAAWDAALSGAGFAGGAPPSLEGALALMGWVGDQVAAVGPAAPGSPWQLLERARAGEGLLCGDLSRLLAEALRQRGYLARTAQLVRSPYDGGDTHVLCEVYLAGRWVALDPTFQVTWCDAGGAPLGAEEAWRALRQGPDRVHPVAAPRRRYPARLEDYGQDWRPLFASLSWRVGPRSWWGRLPPLRWGWGPARYAAGDGALLLEASGHQAAYAVACLVLPALAALSALGAGVGALLGRRAPAYSPS